MIFVIFVFVLGLMVGSFLNVCIYRLPTGDFFRSSRSFCPDCRKPIAWYDNIPILSYIVLGGKCRSCRTTISLVYPVVEIVSGLLFAGFYRWFLMGGTHPGIYIVYLVLASALIVSTVVDLRLMIIPNEITITGVLLAPLASAAVPQLHDGPRIISMILPAGALPEGLIFRADALAASIFSIIVGGGSIYLLGVFGKLIFKKDAMGGGDVKLMGMIGGILGWKMVLVTFFLAPFFAILFAIAWWIKTRDHLIPYGPFLSAAAVTVMVLWKGPLFARLWTHLFP